MGRPDEVMQYLARERTWHIEHIFADHAERHPDLDPLTFRLMRNRLGGLGLLHATDNTSAAEGTRVAGIEVDASLDRPPPIGCANVFFR
jgi:hypothetical protein